MHSSDEELLEVVDEYDRAIACVCRRDIHQKNLIHRAVHVFVFDPEGRIFVQRRSAEKDTHPLKLDSSAAGHVDPGEAYIAAAQRELWEELQIQAELKEVLRLPPSPETGYEHVVLYETVTEAQPVIDPDEILDGWFVGPQELSAHIRQDSTDFVPAFCLLWTRYLERNL